MYIVNPSGRVNNVKLVNKIEDSNKICVRWYIKVDVEK